MHHAITIGGLLLSVGVLGGIVAAAIGLLMAFAGGMSDAPQLGADTDKRGCTVFVIGAAVTIACIVGLVL